MIAERLPQLLTFTKEEKRQLVAELQEELDDDDDPTMQEPLKSEILAELERRYQHYLAHPETAMTVEESRRRMRASRGK
ncbi:MAG: addiction module protein [Verrucomicrobiaceae bacterium]|nr:addiction module protein [Verrucomicrobiaceae bacterium]